MTRKISRLVLDSGAFIKAYHLHDFAENFYCIREVIDEIKDKETKQRLASLPFEINFLQPPQQDIQHIIEFSKKTGDYESLSVVDIKVLALTGYLQRLHVNDEHLTRETVREKVVTSDTQTGRVIRSKPFQDGHMKEDEGWVTPENVNEVAEKLTGLSLGFEEESEVPEVACMTADYAMQNVLLQLGLSLVSVSEARVIRATSHHILRCFACRKTTNDMGKKFCPGCGNVGTLKKVSVSINSDGEKVIHINFRRPIPVRGTNKCLPFPKGGKHSRDPVVVEDQRIPQHKACRKALKEKKLTGVSVIDDPDYVLRSNPFAVNDVHSRAAKHNYLPGKGYRK